MRGVLRWTVRAVLALVGVVVLVVGGFAGFVTYRLNTSLPAIEGEARLAGADGAITIVRDRYGVPHIFATTQADLYRGLGYVHAQDRFVQMDLTRRAMQGRLSEVVGDRAIEMDGRARILGWAGVAQAQLDKASPQARAILEAYTQGVNAALAAMPTPPEYALLMARAEAWRPVDSVAAGLAMTDALTSGGALERARAMLKDTLTPQQIDEFLAPYPRWGARSYSSEDLAAAGSAAAGPAARTMEAPTPGSNAWVVSGERSGTGKPVLANDPHLALNAPGPFYLSRLQGPDGPLIGASLPGAPMIVIGRTRDLAWGTTTHAVDTVDEIPYVTDMEGLTTTSTQTISVNVLGLFMQQQPITIRRTPLGPVMAPRWMKSEKSFAKAYGDREIIIRSTALDKDNGVMEAVRLGASAKTVDAYFEAMKPWTAPPQNLVVADSAGNIGLISPGRFPARDEGGAWSGEITQRILSKNSPRGYYATANNMQTPRDFPHPMPGGHDAYRVTLIDQALAKDRAHTAARAAALQTDQASLLARRLLPILAQARPQTPEGRAMQTALARWDGVARPDASEPAQFAYWTRAFGKALYGDDLGDALYASFQGPREAFLDGVLTGSLSAAWCDVKGTPATESCADTAGAAMDAAAQSLATERGGASQGWRWGDVHAARFRNLVWSGLPLVGDGFTVTVPFGGNATSVNVARNRHDRPDYNTVHAAGMRMVVDFADLNASKFMLAPGQSGHPRSPHYGDLAPLWARGEYFEIRDDWSAENPPESARRLMLRP